MTLNSAPPPTDDELREMYRLYRESDAGHAEPSAEIDRAILDAAREAAAPRRAQPPRRRAPPWWQAWLAPVSVASVAVVGLTLSLHMAEDPGYDARPATSESLPKAMPAAPPPLAPAAEQAKAAPFAQTAPVAPVASVAPFEFAKRRHESIPEVIPMKKEASSEARPVEADRADHSPMPEKMQRQRKENVGSQESFGAAARLAVPAPALAPASAPASAPIRAESESKIMSPHHAAPERWLVEILRLRAAGQTAEANRELEGFRQRYPNHPLPKTLDHPTGR